MNDAVWVAIIVAIPTVLTSVFVPIIMARMVYAQKVADREADWRRQDRIAAELADKVQRDASNVAAANQQVVLNVAESANQSRAKIGRKLDVIHHLVNGNVTESMSNELAALQREILLRREIKLMKERGGVGTDPAGYAAIAMCEARLGELRAALTDRLQRVSHIPPEESDEDPSASQGHVHGPDQEKGG